MKPVRPRLPALDMARGIAVLAMIAFHATWNFSHFGFIDPAAMQHPAALWSARLIASSFLFLSGFALALRHWPEADWGAFARRSAIVAAAAAAVSAVSFFSTPDAPIYFGILHCIAAAGVLAMLVLPLPIWALGLLGAVIIAMPLLEVRTDAVPAVLLFAGFNRSVPAMSDFVPLMPFAGVLLLGAAAGRLRGIRSSLPPAGSAARGGFGPLVLIGRWSLVIYLLHQPVLFGLTALAAHAYPPRQLFPVQQLTRDCIASCAATGGEPSACDKGCRCMAQEVSTAYELDRSTNLSEMSRAEMIRAAARICLKDGGPAE
jgi:uncharacterized membrane protein